MFLTFNNACSDLPASLSSFGFVIRMTESKKLNALSSFGFACPSGQAGNPNDKIKQTK